MRKLLFFLLFILSLQSSAQTADNNNQPQVEMADGFRADGKIYIVVAVVLLVLLGIFAYLFLLEKKLARIENELKSKTIAKS